MSILSQQVLNLSQPTTYGDSDFFVTSCNETAYEWIQEWPRWPNHCLIIYGPKGSGKTHLSHIWARRAGAAFYAFEDLKESNIDQVCRTHPNIVIEDLPIDLDQRILFHIYNASKSEKGSLVLTTSWGPNEGNITLPDLSSRLKSSTWIELSAGDEELLNAMMYKLMADMQIIIPQHVIEYLLKNYERSFATMQEAVRKINNYALATKRKITLPLVKEALMED